MHVLRVDVKTKTGLKIQNYYADGTVESNSIYKNDMVEDFAYVDGNKYTTVSGRVDFVELYFKSATFKPGEAKNFLDVDADVAMIKVDASTENQADVRYISGNEILAYKSTGELKKHKVLPEIKAEVTVFTSDGNSTTGLFEIGKELLNVKIKKKNFEEVEGNFKVAAFIYTIPYNTSDVKLRGVILKGETIQNVSFDEIISCGEKGMVVEDTEKSLEEILADFEADGESGGIILPATSYDQELTIPEDMVIVGANDTPANEGIRCTDEPIEGETIMTNKIVCSEGSTVTISGITVNDVTKIQAGGAKELVLKNCRFFGIEGSNSQFIEDVPTETPVRLKIENCYFGNNSVDTVAKTNIYNLINMHCKVADGSYIKNCYFAKDVCSFNIISIFDVEENATVEISNNIFEKSTNAISLTLKGAPTATFVIKDNEYYESDKNTPSYAGLVLVQCNGKLTETYENVNIILDNNKMPEDEEQLYYVYVGSIEKFTQLTRETLPHVFINGKEEEKVVFYIRGELQE